MEHSPSMKRSAKNVWCDSTGQKGWMVSRSSMYPFFHSLLKMSWTMAVWCAVGVLSKMSKSMRNQS